MNAPLPTPVPQGLRRLLAVTLLLFALLAVNSAYLGAVTLTEALTGRPLEDVTYLWVFLLHLALGLLLTPPFVLFALLHLRRAWQRPNRYAVRAGLGLFASGLLVIASGLLLIRFGALEINHPGWRRVLYWLHLATPLILAWLFILHRLAGPPLRWRRGLAWAALAVLLTAPVLLLDLQRTPAAPEADAYAPSLARVAGGRIPAERLMTDEACAECHADIAKRASLSMHRLSSFNNPAYRASVEDARKALLARDGNLRASGLCAGCHDPAPFFDGRFMRTDFDPDTDASAHAGITCVSCHAITAVNGPRGNSDFTLAAPPAYPLEESGHPLLRALGRQLIRAKPSFHRQTLLKPLHRTAEFCSTCHKVALPQELNHYRWLRGQNHYDSFLLSGVSGHRVDSFYYPDRATERCADCHMPERPSDDPAARDFDGDGRRGVHDHLFAAANTGVPHLLDHPAWGNQARAAMLQGVARVDLFGLREGSAPDGPLHAPLRPALPALKPGASYLLETVVRTLRIGHQLTQGTFDSNELWLDVTVTSGDRVIGRSGALGADGEVDPWAYFVNAYVLDRHGNRIERRNAQDIFVPLYDHQIPPGAASVVHYRLDLPADAREPVTIEVALRYRKFNTGFMRYLDGERFTANRLPIVTLASDRITLPLAGSAAAPASAIPAWQRWNDYGIGLLRAGERGASKGELRQAVAAFSEVERLGHADGPLNLARVHHKEGRLAEAADALRRAASARPPAAPWTVAWLSALVAREEGDLDRASRLLEALAETRFADARRRGFDFSKDYGMLNELGRTLYERARLEGGSTRPALLAQAAARFDQVLALDPENATAHHNLALLAAERGDAAAAGRHRALHERYRRDDQAIERAVSLHRSRNPAANHAAEPVAIYDLRRPGAFGLAAAGQGGGT
jgi:tetratricopeptide (TPR) repeat protein